MKTQTITIIGMNLIGVSIGLALKEAPIEATIIGHDADRDTLQQAKARKAVDKTEWNLLSSVLRADIIILTLPMAELESTLEVIGGDLQSHTVILDLSPQKAEGTRWASAYLKHGHYVGGVPVLAVGGLVDGRSIEAVASADLFRNSLLCLMPSPQAEPEAVETAVNIGLLLGALPYFVELEEFDALMQGISLMPGLVATAVFGAVKESPAWRDILRFADQPFAMATAPLAHAAESSVLAVKDKSATLHWLDAILKALQHIRKLVDEGDVDLLQTLIAERHLEREKWLRTREKNDWSEEARINKTPVPGLADQLMGDYLTQRLRQSEEEK